MTERLFQAFQPSISFLCPTLPSTSTGTPGSTPWTSAPQRVWASWGAWCLAPCRSSNPAIYAAPHRVSPPMPSSQFREDTFLRIRGFYGQGVRRWTCRGSVISEFARPELRDGPADSSVNTRQDLFARTPLGPANTPELTYLPISLSTHWMKYFIFGASVCPSSCWRQASWPSGKPEFSGGIFAV